MDARVSISVRSLVLAVAAALALVLAYLLGAVQGGGDPAAASPPAPAAASQLAVDPAVPTIVMSGSGTATGVPDQLTFGVGVRMTAADVSTALESANRTTRAVLDAVAAQGIDAEDVQTTGLNINADYDYSGEGPAVITGYSVSQSLSVLVRSLPDAGATISAVADAGGNAIRIQNVRLQVGDEDALLAEARDAAIAEAQDKAEQYAAASGRTLGEVLLVREGGGSRTPSVVLRDEAVDAAALSSVPIRAGTADSQVTVSVVWSLE